MEVFVVITLQRNGDGEPLSQATWAGTVNVRPGATRAQVYEFVTNDPSVLREEFRGGRSWVLFYSAEPLQFGGVGSPDTEAEPVPAAPAS